MEVLRGGVAPAERSAARAAHAALAQTWFVHADFLDSEGEPASFDTITCLRCVYMRSRISDLCVVEGILCMWVWG